MPLRLVGRELLIVGNTHQQNTINVSLAADGLVLTATLAPTNGGTSTNLNVAIPFVRKIRVVGGPDADKITVGSSAVPVNVPAVISGGAGDDTVIAGAGRNTIFGGAGNDQIVGGGDHNVIKGCGGADSIIGGVATDILIGGAGDDTLQGVAGDDSIWGGRGADVVAYDADLRPQHVHLGPEGKTIAPLSD